jgi:hypothetical protein
MATKSCLLLLGERRYIVKVYMGVKRGEQGEGKT